MDQEKQHRRRKGPGTNQEASRGVQDSGSQARNPYNSTIRTVTPESTPKEARGASHRADNSTTTASPPLSPRAAQPGSLRHLTRPLPHRAGSSDADYGRRSNTDLSTRRRTRTMEDKPRDRPREGSPTSNPSKGRQRVGSVHSTSPTPNQLGSETSVPPLGQPTAVSPPPQPPARSHAQGRNRLLKQHVPRDESPMGSVVTPPDGLSASFILPNGRKILQLMRTLCGRMQGRLAFRRGIGSLWALYYCYIDEESGALVYEPKDGSTHRTLIPDLRGCQAKNAYDPESYTPYLEVSLPNSCLEVHLRPPTPGEFDSWYAALLCWQPIRPKGIQNRMAKPQAPLSSTARIQDGRRHSEVSLLKEAPIIKVGKMIFWDTNVSYSNPGTTKSSRPIVYRLQSFGSRRWRRVSCTLRENGELKLYAETDVTLVSIVQLSQLSRSAIQRLDPSVLDNEFCIAIYPQYTSTSTSMTLTRPIFLSLEGRVLYEVWIVLLRAFTIPQLYGPRQDLNNEDGVGTQKYSTPKMDMFRMERSLSIRVIEARLTQPPSPRIAEHSFRPGTSNQANHAGGHFVDLLLDGEIRARTMTKDESGNPFWREDFEFSDVPAIVSTATLTLKRRPPYPPLSERDLREESKAIQEAIQSAESSGTKGGVSFDQTLGKVDVYLDDLEPHQPVEKWWPLINVYGHNIGEMLTRVEAKEDIILMARDYQPLSELLHRFSNGLTTQIAHGIPGQLKELSNCLLNIFQVSGQVSEWIMALIEEEIDGTLKDSPMARLRYSKRLGSGESTESLFGSMSDREMFLRDMNNNAKLEANLLFRGNTLLTKTVDAHMKRVGKEYLEETLADKMKEIADRDPDCEVDPNRLRFQHDLERNWRKLLSVTEEVWKCIYHSASRCPIELKITFRHVRACAEDRYGDFLRSVSYSSVSGFLFLRFFCAAVLNPKLFGLLKDHPRPRARRTLTLIAKSLQGLANMTTFGSKEDWMEPMNQFLHSHRQEFKTFIDSVCSVPSERSPTAIPPSYSTPLAILQRLPPTSREGFPSLPYLIDHAKNFAELVDLWLDNTKDAVAVIQSSDDDVRRFHNICVNLRRRTEDCLERAERAERPDSSLSMKWEELVEQLEQSSHIDPVSTVPTIHPPPSGIAGGTSIIGGSYHRALRYGASNTASSSVSTTATAAGPYSPSSDVPPDETPPGSAGGGGGGFGSMASGNRSGADMSHYVGSNFSSDAENTTALPKLDRSAEKDKGPNSNKKLGGFGFKKKKDRDRDKDRDKEKDRDRPGKDRNREKDHEYRGHGGGRAESSHGGLEGFVMANGL